MPALREREGGTASRRICGRNFQKELSLFLSRPEEQGSRMEPQANPKSPAASTGPIRPRRNPKLPRQKLPLLDIEARTPTCQEVALGFSEDPAGIEYLFVDEIP